MMGEEPVLCVRSTVDSLSGKARNDGRRARPVRNTVDSPSPGRLPRARSWLTRISEPSSRRRGSACAVSHECQRRRGYLHVLVRNHVLSQEGLSRLIPLMRVLEVGSC